MEVSLRATVREPLAEADLAAYRAPYPTRDSRRPLLAWPRAFPIEGAAGRCRRAGAAAYDAWLGREPGGPEAADDLRRRRDRSLIGPEMADWCRRTIAALDVVGCGPARHLAPEDQHPRRSPPPSPPGPPGTACAEASGAPRIFPLAVACKSADVPAVNAERLSCRPATSPE